MVRAREPDGTGAPGGTDPMLSRRPTEDDVEPGQRRGGQASRRPAQQPAARAAKRARRREQPQEMPGGTAGYAGRGDTASGPEAPGGTDGYASEHEAGED
jgi:hypothetical protein